MNIEDSNDFKRVVSFFWGVHNARLVPLNEQSVTAVVGALESVGACSDMSCKNIVALSYRTRISEIVNGLY